jgi:hypothetical protein
LNRIVADATKDGMTFLVTQVKEEKHGDGRPYKIDKDAKFRINSQLLRLNTIQRNWIIPLPKKHKVIVKVGGRGELTPPVLLNGVGGF